MLTVHAELENRIILQGLALSSKLKFYFLRLNLVTILTKI